MKRYVAYCRAKCKPRLSASAAGVLKDHYVTIRQDLVGAGREDNDPDAPPPAIPITVRQLEAIVRLSEALAKMRLLDEVHDEQVRGQPPTPLPLLLPPPLLILALVDWLRLPTALICPGCQMLLHTAVAPQLLPLPGDHYGLRVCHRSSGPRGDPSVPGLNPRLLQVRDDRRVDGLH